MRRVLSTCLPVLSLGLLSGPPAALAQDQTRTLRVATRLVSPLVIDDHGELTGFSIDLWHGIASELKACLANHGPSATLGRRCPAGQLARITPRTLA
jgi:ABC-type amino acid transport substrate-binding protein